MVQYEGQSVNIQFEVSRRVTQRIASEIMKIFLVEVLGYTGVTMIKEDNRFDATEAFERLSEIFYSHGRTGHRA